MLLPSATVFLLLHCNDKAVLGPRVNSVRLNVFTGAVIILIAAGLMLVRIGQLVAGGHRSRLAIYNEPQCITKSCTARAGRDLQN
jgi:hypothetical protein